jgi:hypothetical protein
MKLNNKDHTAGGRMFLLKKMMIERKKALLLLSIFIILSLGLMGSWSDGCEEIQNKLSHTQIKIQTKPDKFGAWQMSAFEEDPFVFHCFCQYEETIPVAGMRFYVLWGEQTAGVDMNTILLNPGSYYSHSWKYEPTSFHELMSSPDTITTEQGDIVVHSGYYYAGWWGKALDGSVPQPGDKLMVLAQLVGEDGNPFTAGEANIILWQDYYELSVSDDNQGRTNLEFAGLPDELNLTTIEGFEQNNYPVTCNFFINSQLAEYHVDNFPEIPNCMKLNISQPPDKNEYWNGNEGYWNEGEQIFSHERDQYLTKSFYWNGHCTGTDGTSLPVYGKPIKFWASLVYTWFDGTKGYTNNENVHYITKLVDIARPLETSVYFTKDQSKNIREIPFGTLLSFQDTPHKFEAKYYIEPEHEAQIDHICFSLIQGDLVLERVELPISQLNIGGTSHTLFDISWDGMMNANEYPDSYIDITVQIGFKNNSGEWLTEYGDVDDHFSTIVTEPRSYLRFAFTEDNPKPENFTVGQVNSFAETNYPFNYEFFRSTRDLGKWKKSVKLSMSFTRTNKSEQPPVQTFTLLDGYLLMNPTPEREFVTSSFFWDGTYITYSNEPYNWAAWQAVGWGEWAPQDGDEIKLLLYFPPNSAPAGLSYEMKINIIDGPGEPDPPGETYIRLQNPLLIEPPHSDYEYCFGVDEIKSWSIENNEYEFVVEYKIDKNDNRSFDDIEIRLSQNMDDAEDDMGPSNYWIAEKIIRLKDQYLITELDNNSEVKTVKLKWDGTWYSSLEGFPTPMRTRNINQYLKMDLVFVDGNNEIILRDKTQPNDIPRNIVIYEHDPLYPKIDWDIEPLGKTTGDPHEHNFNVNDINNKSPNFNVNLGIYSPNKLYQYVAWFQLEKNNSPTYYSNKIYIDGGYENEFEYGDFGKKKNYCNVGFPIVWGGFTEDLSGEWKIKGYLTFYDENNINNTDEFILPRPWSYTEEKIINFTGTPDVPENYIPKNIEYDYLEGYDVFGRNSYSDDLTEYEEKINRTFIVLHEEITISQDQYDLPIENDGIVDYNDMKGFVSIHKTVNINGLYLAGINKFTNVPPRPGRKYAAGYYTNAEAEHPEEMGILIAVGDINLNDDHIGEDKVTEAKDRRIENVIHELGHHITKGSSHNGLDDESMNKIDDHSCVMNYGNKTYIKYDGTDINAEVLVWYFQSQNPHFCHECLKIIKNKIKY